jgi:hypothetical protein
MPSVRNKSPVDILVEQLCQPGHADEAVICDVGTEASCLLRTSCSAARYVDMGGVSAACPRRINTMKRLGWQISQSHLGFDLAFI